MKQVFFSIAILVLSCGVDKTFAQTIQMDNPNVAAGHFEMNIANGKQTNEINVNYSIAPLPGKIKLELSSPDAILFTVDISDAAGSILKIWAPTASSHHYQDNIDISYLPAGDYNVNIHRDNSSTILYSIPFTKNI